MSRYSGTPPLDSFGNWLRARRVPCGQTWEKQMRKHEGRCMQALRWRHLHVYGSIIDQYLPQWSQVLRRPLVSTLTTTQVGGSHSALSQTQAWRCALHPDCPRPSPLQEGRRDSQPHVPSAGGRKRLDLGNRKV
jgi:hypothetical protein